MTGSAVSSSNPAVTASSWIEGALTGSIATTIAVLAIASIGLLMLSGRLNVRRSARVILGCFIIFGASTIAAGIQSAIIGADNSASTAELDPMPYHAPTTPAQLQSLPAATDPYAGAAVPRR